MGLKLTGKGSILDSIGGGLNEVANAGISAAKNFGDIVGAGVGAATGNAQAEQNAENAVSSNDSNLAHEDLATNLGGLSGDTGVTQAAKAFINTGAGAATDIVNAADGTNLDSEDAIGGGRLGGLTKWASNGGTVNEGSGRELAGNAIMTGVNLATLGKGKGIEELGEKGLTNFLGDRLLARAAARVGGSALVGGLYGAGQGTGNAVQTATSPEEAAGDIIKPAVENAALAGGIGGITAAPGVIRAGLDARTPLDEVGGINNRAVPAPLTPDEAQDLSPDVESKIHESNPLAPQQTEINAQDEMPEPALSDLESSQAAAENLDQSMSDPSVDWDKVQGANVKLNGAIQSVADTMRGMDVGARGGIRVSDGEGGQIRSSEHTQFYRKVYEETGRPPTKAAYLDEAKKYVTEKALKGDDEEGLAYRELLKHAQAEKDVEDYQKADKASGYSKAKHQIPKGAPAKPFMQDLYEKTHSPEFSARNEVGTQLKDVRDTMQGVKTLRDRAQKEYDALTKRSSSADADTIRAKAAELRSQNTRYRVLDTQEKDLSTRYRQASGDLNAKYPDRDLVVPKKGVRLSSNAPQFETTKPVERAPVAKSEPGLQLFRGEGENMPNEGTNMLGNGTYVARDEKTASLYGKAKAVASSLKEKEILKLNNETDYQKFFTDAQKWGVKNKILDEQEFLPQYAKSQGYKAIEAAPGLDERGGINIIDDTALKPAAEQKPYDLAEVLGHPLDTTSYTGPNLNEDIFSPESIAEMKREEGTDTEFPASSPGRNVEGDRAILAGIKNGDSDATIVKAYMDATGSSLEDAKSAYGLLEDDPNVDKTGAVENNPYHGKVANYDIEIGKPHGAGKLFVRSKTAGANLINKALLRATAPGDQLAYKLSDEHHLWQQLKPEDQALADSLRNHSIEEVASKAKDPAAFTAYATRVKDIQDYILATKQVADPFDITPYRQHYGAGFNLASEDGNIVTPGEALGQDDVHSLQRHYTTYEELKDATGLDRASENFHEDVVRDVARAQNQIAQNSLYNGLQQAFGKDRVAYGQPTRAANVQLKDFKNVYADKAIADRINSRANYEYGVDAFGSLLKGGDKLNAAMKNVKLSVGGFHNINEMLNQLALDPTHAGEASKALVDSGYFRSRMNEWDANGTMEKALHSGLTIGAGDEFKAGLNKLPIIHQAHEALFGRQIPFSKMQVFERYTKGLDLNSPEDYDKMRGVARGINNTFGGINRLVDGLNPTRMKQLSRVVLAEDYNEGQIRTLLSAFTKGGIEGRMARQVVAGRAAILALPGTIQGIVTGKIGNNPKQVAEFVGNQLVNPTVQTPFKTKSGIPKQISLVAGIVNKADRAVAPAFNKNNPDKLSGVKQELSGNLSPGASLVEEEKNNADYYGNPMHGDGMSAAEDVAQLINAAAPIPANPGARALEGTRLGNNRLVKIAAGGQSAISPAEAAIDTSGIGRVASNPNSPQMKVLNSREVLYSGLKTAPDKQALTYIHPSWSGSATAAEEKAIYSSPNYEINKWNSLRENTPGSAVYGVLKKQDQVAQKNGEPGDPLLKLSSDDYQTVTEYEFLKHADEGTDANNTAAVMYTQNKAMIDKYEQDNTTYEGQMNALYATSGGIKGDTSPVESVGGAPQYNETPQQTQLSNQYFAMNDTNSTSQQRAQFLAANPELNQLFQAQFNAENAIRKQQDEPLLKPYPAANPTLNNWMNQYSAASKDQRSALRDSNPTLYNQMSQYMAQVDQYQLAKTLGQTQFQGDDVNQDQLKEEYNLGQYDINKAAGADGNDTYTLDPQAAYATDGATGAEGEVQKLLNENKARDVKNTVKYDYKPVKIRIRNSRSTYLKRVGVTVHAKSAPKVRVKAKSVAIK